MAESTEWSEWPRDELEDAFSRYQAEVVRCVEESDWTIFADLFTPDATYDEHAYGQFQGRDAIRTWVVKTMTSFPGNTMTSFPIAWHTVDVEKGWILCDVRNLMPDPGDGSEHEASNLTILHYAGDGLWSHEADIYNPMKFLSMAAGWAEVAARHDRLSPEAAAWLKQFGGMAGLAGNGQRRR